MTSFAISSETLLVGLFAAMYLVATFGAIVALTEHVEEKGAWASIGTALGGVLWPVLGLYLISRNLFLKLLGGPT